MLVYIVFVYCSSIYHFNTACGSGACLRWPQNVLNKYSNMRANFGRSRKVVLTGPYFCKHGKRRGGEREKRLGSRFCTFSLLPAATKFTLQLTLEGPLISSRTSFRQAWGGGALGEKLTANLSSLLDTIHNKSGSSSISWNGSWWISRSPHLKLSFGCNP